MTEREVAIYFEKKARQNYWRGVGPTAFRGAEITEWWDSQDPPAETKRGNSDRWNSLREKALNPRKWGRRLGPDNKWYFVPPVGRVLVPRDLELKAEEMRERQIDPMIRNERILMSLAAAIRSTTAVLQVRGLEFTDVDLQAIYQAHGIQL
jgi:hypothetical protein